MKSNSNRKGRWGLLLAAVCAVVVACGEGGTSTGGGDGRVRVVAALYPLQELAARVGGEAVDVTNLTPPGSEPHDLELTTRQADRVLDADLVLYLGDFQPAVDDLVGRSDGSSLDVLDALEVAAEEHPEDPHFWLDPLLFAEAVGHVEEALVRAAPEHGAAIRSNADGYADELHALHDEFEAGLADCARRTIVTAHEAFGYLARRYGLEERSVAGLSPEAEPDPRRLAELSDVIRDEGVTTVFYEATAMPEVAETLARETGAHTATLDPIETLASDDADAGADYASVMRDNLAALRSALGCA